MKLKALRDASRLLRPAGRLVIADWGQPQGTLTQAGFFVLPLLDGFQNTADHAAGRLPSLRASRLHQRESWPVAQPKVKA